MEKVQALPFDWSEVVNRVAEKESDQNQKNILLMFRSQVNFTLENDNLTFFCSSSFIFDLFAQYAFKFFEEICSLVGRENLILDIKMRSAANASNPAAAQSEPAATESKVSQAAAPAANTASSSAAPNVSESEANKFIRQGRINPDKTFENYVTDPENLLIYNIAKRVASEPGSSTTNPFYIYGASGLGKTHLLFAIANKIRKEHPQVNLIYTRAEEFIRSYVEAMSRRNSYDFGQVHFQDLYTRKDVIIVDDIQNFIKAPKTRDAFFDIISEFLEIPHRQLILASDVPPGNLKDFSPRLKSRFGSGVCREIYPPSTETRTAITLKKCREFKVNLPDNIIDYIANNIRSNVREIEGAIKTLNMIIEEKGEIQLDDAIKSLANLINVSSQIITIEQIKDRVAHEFDVSVSSMESAERKKMVSQARSIAMTLANDLIPSLSLNDIGRAFNKDHSSVHEAIKRTRQRIFDDKEFEITFHKLTLSLKKE